MLKGVTIPDDIEVREKSLAQAKKLLASLRYMAARGSQQGNIEAILAEELTKIKAEHVADMTKEIKRLSDDVETLARSLSVSDEHVAAVVLANS